MRRLFHDMANKPTEHKPPETKTGQPAPSTAANPTPDPKVGQSGAPLEPAVSSPHHPEAAKADAPKPEEKPEPGISLVVNRATEQGLRRILCTLRGGVWTCADDKFLKTLQQVELDPSGYYPDRDMALAQLVKSYYGDVEITDTRPHAEKPEDKDTVY